ncbi:lipid-A-disaccharide synthase [Thermovibrio sp.]
MKKLLVVAGELSGSLYGQELSRRLKERFKVYSVLHGEVEGVERIYDSKRLTAFGLVEGIRKLPEIVKAKRLITRFFEKEKPEGVVLIDFPGFNLKVAKEAKKRGIKVFYFIPPKVWAWGENRIKTIKEVVDRLFVIFPFEVEFYERHGIRAEFYGNPLVEMVRPKLKKEEFLKKFSLKEPLYSLLPGSRESEVKYLLKPLLETSRKLKGTAGIPVASTVNFKEVNRVKEELSPKVKLFSESLRYELLWSSRLGVIASGTASLEAALLLLPHAVVYKLNPITYFIAKRLVKTKFISLPNIIAGREILPELIQDKVNPSEILKALESLERRKKEVRETLKEEVVERLKGNCFEGVASAIEEELS